MSSEAKQPGQRAYEAMSARLGYGTGLVLQTRWEKVSPETKADWAAVEQACAVPAAELTVRPVVRWFAEQMEAALRRNDHKGGWHNDAPTALSERIVGEYAELETALAGPLKREGWLRVVAEAADVANMAMMVADHFREGGPSKDQGHDLAPAPAPSATPSKSEGEWVAPGEPRRRECADPNCGLSTDTAEAFRVIRDCEQYDYCHVECAMSHERDLGRQDGIAETEAEWVSVSGSVPALFPYERQFAWVDLPGREATVMQWKAHHWWGLDHRGQSVAFRMSHVSRYCPLPSPPKAPDAT